MENNLIEKFKCFSINGSHFIRQPITLECGHSACKICLIENKDDDNRIKCQKCGINITIPADLDHENESLKAEFQSNIEYLFISLQDNFLQYLSDLRGWVLNINIDNRIELIREDIEIRIESLKNQLDEFNNIFQKNLERLRNELFLENSKILENDKDVNKIDYEAVAEALRNNIEKNIDKNEENLYYYENNLCKMRNLITKLSERAKNVAFESSEITIPIEIIGEVVEKVVNHSDLKLKILHENYKMIELNNFHPSSLCKLPNNKLLTCNNNSLTIFDKNLKLISIVRCFDGENLYNARYATTNKKNRIYLTNSNKIFVTDLDLNKIKAVGSRGTGNNEYDRPCGLAYYDDWLYVCDTNNKRVQKLTSELDFKEAFALDYNPIQIKIANRIAFVSGRSNQNAIYFYNIKDFSIKHCYDGHSGNLSEINSYFYEYYHQNRSFYCYDQTGNLTDMLKINAFELACADVYDGSLEIFNGKLYATSESSKSIIQF